MCDNCNLLFRGFALPGTVPAHGTHRRHRRRHTGGRGQAGGGRGE
ncbi:MAG TPA: hypothetical protein VF570_00010 [Pyrinomonadaceae bacterium]